MTPLAVYLAISGIDDLFVDVAWLTLWLGDRHKATTPPPRQPERRIAVFVPLWRESAVIEQMLSHNIAALNYDRYTFFCGGYPNDQPTLDAVRDMAARSNRVQLAVCPHDGPTSKADCLNWIYQRMLDYERRTGKRFELIVTHDAEDILHPESLQWLSDLSRDYDFIQIPVLALRTPAGAFTHGIYCDEFAEFQTRDLPVRSRLGGFVPSAGVGTGYSRRALDALARVRQNQVFDPESLTEDYENGLRLHELGFRQVFVPPTHAGNSWVATREYFPQSFRAAVRQRTRWVTGISLQSWDRHGWTGSRQQKYWLWRDRKGLIGSPLSLLTNALTVYALASGLWDRVTPPRYVVDMFALTVGAAGAANQRARRMLGESVRLEVRGVVAFAGGVGQRDQRTGHRQRTGDVQLGADARAEAGVVEDRAQLPRPGGARGPEAEAGARSWCNRERCHRRTSTGRWRHSREGCGSANGWCRRER